ncbi:EamA family transporter [Allobranchiibius huperziae]|uniref:Drug/metabolite transporter (DMT)-like permease n=1 Tax=Allobranchiibius huperziae TaxID=1874116 RepID=A0A853DE79_9MICO|nr:drug/metabolite transporter (DMT)-like permease [Allobranchiibius huperziae]
MTYLLALLSSLVWGSSDFAGGLFTRRAHAVQVVFASQVGGLIITCVAMAVAVSSGHAPQSGLWPVYGAFAGLCGCVGLCAFYAALSSGTMGVVSPIAALGAIVPVVLGVLGGEHIGLLTGAGMALALAGAALASGPELSGEVSRRPLGLAVVAAVGFGLALYLLHQASATSVLGGLWAMRVTSIVALGLLLTVWRTRPSGIPGPHLSRRLIPLAMLAGSADLSANALFGIASTSGAVGVVSVLGSLYPVMTLLLARGFLHERLRRVQLVGVMCAVVGVALTVS